MTLLGSLRIKLGLSRIENRHDKLQSWIESINDLLIDERLARREAEVSAKERRYTDEEAEFWKHRAEKAEARVKELGIIMQRSGQTPDVQIAMFKLEEQRSQNRLMQARQEALEEAATMCESNIHVLDSIADPRAGTNECHAADARVIRSLKEKP